jgi:hypothetical protein
MPLDLSAELLQSLELDKAARLASFSAPDTKYYLDRVKFDEAVGRDFIKYANLTLSKGQPFLVGLSHGQSTAGAYQYIIDHYSELKEPKNIRYTFVNSPTEGQQSVKGVTDARTFIKKLFRSGLITRRQILGNTLERASLEDYTADFNQKMEAYLKKHDKKGLDYVFLTTNPRGRVAGIERNSKAFESQEVAVGPLHCQYDAWPRGYFGTAAAGPLARPLFAVGQPQRRFDFRAAV